MLKKVVNLSLFLGLLSIFIISSNVWTQDEYGLFKFNSDPNIVPSSSGPSYVSDLGYQSSNSIANCSPNNLDNTALYQKINLHYAASLAFMQQARAQWDWQGALALLLVDEDKTFPLAKQLIESAHKEYSALKESNPDFDTRASRVPSLKKKLKSWQAQLQKASQYVGHKLKYDREFEKAIVWYTKAEELGTPISRYVYEKVSIEIIECYHGLAKRCYDRGDNQDQGDSQQEKKYYETIIDRYLDRELKIYSVKAVFKIALAKTLYYLGDYSSAKDELSEAQSLSSKLLNSRMREMRLLRCLMLGKLGYSYSSPFERFKQAARGFYRTDEERDEWLEQFSSSPTPLDDRFHRKEDIEIFKKYAKEYQLELGK